MTYSIIIPHKNIPDLLQRCLDSIPSRPDVEVIVVDDNSIPEVVNKLRLINKPGLKLVYTKEGKGAGYARNIGLQHATGTWVLFADADDKFTETAFSGLDKCQKEDYDVVIFKTECKNADDMSKNGARQYLCEQWNKNIDNYRAKLIQRDTLLGDMMVPWGKMVRRIFLYANNIKFEEIKYSNDIFWSFLLWKHSKEERVLASSSLVYCLLERADGLTKDYTSEAFLIRFYAGMRTNRAIHKAGLSMPIKEIKPFPYYYQEAKLLGSITLLKASLYSIFVAYQIPLVYKIENKLNFKKPYFYITILNLQSFRDAIIKCFSKV